MKQEKIDRAWKTHIGLFIPVYWNHSKKWAGSLSLNGVPIGVYIIVVALIVHYLAP